ncbi:asparagine synthase [Endozoicomonas sp. SM1973]|uniref:asparagine synthase (glutamine-hydrolyzing) n=1 Tax=Spartinivicinus marinus TaxID=2994442 RepID=A0A853I4R6_9GAMM|nr:asparagine synthase-related protein [Spartinivicinus marinus]MCX4024977.1 asparagine synthase-related protein [Spartinivicinus marinus]NYZ67669.1 asparagine synthase [Spartinivicinus marinus]
MIPFGGWLTPHPLNEGSAVETLKTLLPCPKHHSLETFVNTNLALINTADHTSHLAQQDSITVLINGYPQWVEAPYNHISNKQNPAAAAITAYQAIGLNCLSKLHGQFSLFLYDHQQDTFILATDRMATQPVYYQLHSNQLFFGSFASVIKNHPDSHTALCNQAIYNYLYFHMIPSPGTIYDSLYKLEPAQYICYQSGQFNKGYYWSPSFTDRSQLTDNELAGLILSTLKSAVSRANQQGSVGSFLSGGLDSSTVSGLLSELSSLPAKTFSIGFPVEKYNEIEYARLAAKHFNTEQHEYFIQPEDILSHYQQVITGFDEPFGNSSALPAYFCAKLAKQHGVDVMLAGDGGDELFAGNTRYQKQIIFELYHHIPGLLRQRALEPVVRQPWFSKLPLGGKAYSYIDQANTPLPDRLETYNFLHRHSPVEIFSSMFLQDVDVQLPLREIQQTYQQPDKADYISRMLFLDWKRTLADNDLPKVNRMCYLAGIDVRYPMLDDELVDLSCVIPSSLKVNLTQLRGIYKQAVKGFLPDAIINKSKHGFGLPFGVWTKDHQPLQTMAYEAIDYLVDQPYFNPDFLVNAKAMHQQGHSAYYGELIWLLMTLGSWLKTHIN